MLELIGWIGGITLSICALPQVIHTYKTKNTSGLSSTYLLLWLKGELLTLGYILIHDFEQEQFQTPLYLNYLLNLLMACYLIYAKYWYSNNHCAEKSIRE